MQQTSADWRLCIGTGKLDLSDVGLGDSIAVNGTCLTVADMEDDKLMFDVLGETFDKTNLGEKGPGDVVNLEQALAPCG